jgi:hypothetical protein
VDQSLWQSETENPGLAHELTLTTLLESGFRAG